MVVDKKLFTDIIGLTITINESAIMSNTKTIKQLNTDKVKEALINADFSTKVSLASATGLSVATCGNIIKELLASGEIIEVEQAESTGGRPSRQFAYNKDFSYVLAVYARKERKDLTIAYSVQTLTNEVIEESIVECDKVYIQKIDDIVGKLTAKYPNIKVLSMGVPGVVIDNGIDFCDINALSGIDITKHYFDKFNLTAVAENDVNMTALGYYQNICDEKIENFVYLYYPIDGGPGAGIIINGRIMHGTSNFAGEVSYLPHYTFDFNGEIKDESVNLSENTAKTIMTINCLINPKTIVVSGFSYSQNLIHEIKYYIEKNIPSNHRPNIIFEEDIHENYIKGLASLAKEQLTCKVEIIER